MLPAMGFLIFFWAYPLGPRHLDFIHRRADRGGRACSSGTENYEWLWGDFDLLAVGVQYRFCNTSIASAIKFAVGLYLAPAVEQTAVQACCVRWC